MPLTISGKLSLPVTGQPASNAQIRFQAVNSVDEVISGAESVARCDATGNYSISIEFCRYELSTKISTVEYVVHGIVNIDKDTKATDLEDLITLIGVGEQLDSDLIKQFEQIKADTEAARDEAVQAADRAVSATVTKADNFDVFAASGHIHFGKHSSDNINEGLSTSSKLNTLVLGGTLGASLTEKPVLHINGWKIEITETDITFPSVALNAGLSDRVDVWGYEFNEVDQTCVIRTIAGTANGDWLNTNCADGDLKFNASTPITSTKSGANFVKPVYQGAFTDNSGSHFLFGSSVLRLNPGAFHPSFNNLGSALFSDGKKWHETTVNVTSKSDCFVNPIGGNKASGKSGRDDDRYFDVIYASGQGGANDSRMSAFDMGTIEQKAKVEVKVENGTYRGEEKLVFTTLNQQTATVASSYQGKWYVKFGSTQYISAEDKPRSYLYNVTKNDLLYPAHVEAGGNVYTTNDPESVYASSISEVQNSSNNNGGGAWAVGDVVILVVGSEVDETVSGDFTCRDVAGPPASILQNPALQEGWYGYWVPHMGASGSTPLTRQCLTTTASIKYTNDNGTTWTTDATAAVDQVTNSLTGSQDRDNYVWAIQYTAFAYQTKESGRQVVLNGDAGIGNVRASMSNRLDYSVCLGESTLGLITKVAPTAGLEYINNKKLLEWAFTSDGRLYGTNNSLGDNKHEPLSLRAPVNDSQAFKFLSTQCEINGQANIQFNANQLKWISVSFVARGGEDTTTTAVGTTYYCNSGKFDGRHFVCVSSASVAFNDSRWILTPEGSLVFGGTTHFVAYRDGWGDDARIKIGNGTFSDRNGQTCLMSNHVLAKPLGYTKKKAEIGESTKADKAIYPMVYGYYNAF